VVPVTYKVSGIWRSVVSAVGVRGARQEAHRLQGAG